MHRNDSNESMKLWTNQVWTFQSTEQTNVAY